MRFDVRDRVVGQVLADFGDDALLHVGMEGAAQVGERARRRGDDDGGHVVGAHEFFQFRRHAFDEPMLLEMMPVGLFHGAATMRASALDAASGPVGALFVGRGFSSVNTCLVSRSRNFSSPALRRNSALRPSPMNTTASWGMASLVTLKNSRKRIVRLQANRATPT